MIQAERVMKAEGETKGTKDARAAKVKTHHAQRASIVIRIQILAE